MKLRNKKSGEIEYLLFNSYPVSGDIVLEYMDENAESGYSEYCRYSSLAKLNEEWEDYKTPEPLIKDEKIRKAVRAWADACNLSHVTYKQASNEFYDANTRGAFAIRFTCIPIEVYLEDEEHYTIAELCGEEEG